MGSEWVRKKGREVWGVRVNESGVERTEAVESMRCTTS